MITAYDSLLFIAASGVLAGFLTGLVSLGGAFIVVPALYHAIMQSGVSSRESFTMAVATSVAFVLVSSLSAASTYARRSLINYRITVVVCVGALFGVVAGINLFSNVDDSVVRLGFGVFIWLFGLYILLSRYYLLGSEYSGMAPTLTLARNMIMLVVGSVVGLLVSAFGIGGGGVIAPSVSYATKSDMKSAVATGVGATVAISMMATIGYVVDGIEHGQYGGATLGWVHIQSLLLLIPCALVSAPLGAKVAIRMSNSTLMMILGGCMFAVGLKMVLS